MNLNHNYEILGQIGEGGFGKVYKARDSENDNIIAIKEISIETLNKFLNQYNDSTDELFEREVNIMKKLRHRNSCELIGSKKINNKYYIFMKCYDTDLYKLLEKKYPNGMSIDLVRKILIQLNPVFKKMNDLKIIHRDIKPNNFLIEFLDEEKTQFNVILSDFSIGRFVNDGTYLTENKGTFNFVAPEIINNKNNYSFNADIYSLGITILFMLKKKDFNINPFEIYNGNIPKTNNNLLNDLLSKMLKKDPQQRINWNEYFRHDFFKINNNNNIIINIKPGIYNNLQIIKVNNFIIKNTKNNHNNNEIKSIVTKYKLNLKDNETYEIKNETNIKTDGVVFKYLGNLNGHDILQYDSYFTNHCPYCFVLYGDIVFKGQIRKLLGYIDSSRFSRGNGVLCHNCGYAYYLR